MENSKALEALGRITQRFSGLEFGTGVLLSGFISADAGVSQIVVADEGMEWRLRKLRVIAVHAMEEGELQQELMAWIAAVQAAKDERNRMMHGLLQSSEGGFTRLRITSRRRWQWVTHEVSTAELENFAVQLGDLNKRMMLLAERLAKDAPGFHGEWG